MRIDHIVFVLVSVAGLRVSTAAEPELLVASQDAPMYLLSNFRTEIDQFGYQSMLVDFRRTRKGGGAVSVRGKSPQGLLSIAASVSPSVESGTMQLKSFLPNREQRQLDIELFFAQTHEWGDGVVRYAVVSNAVRLGNPGASIKPRAWTPDDERAYAEYKRMMADDSAQKPRKAYPVSIDVPEDCQFVPEDVRVAARTPLEACYDGKWNPLTALSENKDGSINVRWDDYGAKYDCSMTRDQLIIKKALVVRGADGSLTTLSREESVARGLVELPAKPLKKYPVTIAVPQDSQTVPADAAVKPGTRLQACYASKWNPITAPYENKDGTLTVRWDDYGKAFDCSMARDELIIKKSDLPRSPDPSAPESGIRTWTDATGKFQVRAKLLRKSESSVTLLTEAGREVTLPLAKLSQADLEFLRGSSGTSK